ncbi:hypothetical protein [Pseudodesulfovibrio sp. zrk46]|uniref:hypothetical protein n=1 Tax=Pseudodesulfovibrio sp. zrk46 TaxID=2725288 RepID=UPI001449CBC5|nr:hypothetical protein [Pseudodesulfovibrio sp. zrk46]QJB56604.1 hypothetical protein HFN16_09360 [Pseudodesulfovibrio sp. zrk46]
MAGGRKATIIRVLKPIVAGVALAYLATAFVDKPAPVHFQPENPYAAKQEEIVETQADLVTEKNIMKLGSPLSVLPNAVVTENNPLAGLERIDGAGNGTFSANDSDANATGVVRKDVEEAPEAP